jgi:cobalt/nickel transport system permease protein
MIPDWMKTVEIGPCSCCTTTVGKKKNFVNKTLSGVFSFFEETMTSENYSRRKGLLQSLDPRVKLITIVALIVSISVLRNPWILLLVYVLTLIFALLSKINPLFFIKRVWVFVPIFAGIIILPLIFNIFYPGDSILTLWYLGKGAHLGPFALPDTIAITRQGVLLMTIFTLRVGTCVSATVLLFLTTPKEQLFRSLRSVGIPKIYVLTLDMCYRYIFMFMEMVKDFYTAKKSRTIRSMGTFEDQKWVGGRIGYTLVKSIDMAEKVHGAMISRGFNGDVKILVDYHMKPRDYVALLSVLSFSVILTLISYNIIKI